MRRRILTNEQPLKLPSSLRLKKRQTRRQQA
jgi:hypothetical protein